MKTEKNSSGIGSWVLRHPIENTKHTIFRLPFLALAAALAFAVFPAKAQITNTLLVNASFDNANSGNVIPTGWTYFAPPGTVAADYWIIHVGDGSDGGVEKTDADGNPDGFWYKQWNAIYNPTNNNVAGIYQTFGSAPGAVYQANGYITSSSADLLPSANDSSWIQVEFLDANSNLLSVYKSSVYTVNVGNSTWFQFTVSNACDVTQPVSTGDPYFTTYSVTGNVSQLVAPAGTALVTYRLCDLFYLQDGGSVYFDDAVLDEISGPVPPVINNINPQNEIFAPPASNFTFSVISPSGHTINTSGIQVLINGSDVSSSLVITGNATNKNVSYDGLQSNATYSATINITDAANLRSSASTTFQTTWAGVPAPTYIWEAEDWDFSGGMYYDNPDLCNAPGNSQCYFGVVGEPGVDEYNAGSGAPPSQFYRGASDGIGTQPSGDYSRPNLTAADRIDYYIDPFNNNEWVNYTRDWPNSTNFIIGRFANGGAAGGDALYAVTATSTNFLGNFLVTPTGSWTTFQYFYLLSANGVNKAVVALNGKETLRLVAGVNGTANALPTFFMLVSGSSDFPVVTGLYPTGTHPFEPTNALSFTVTTAGATFPANGIQVTLDGFNISSNLVINGSSSSNYVMYPYLQTNEMHLAIITVTNSLGHGISITNQFDTFTQSNYIIQAEDYDFSGGQYVASSQYYPDCYQGGTSITNVDFHHTYTTNEPTSGIYPYRVNGIPQATTSDYYLASFAINPIEYYDYNLIWFQGGDWANYTRDYPDGAYNVYARSSGLGPDTMDLGKVISGLGTTNQTVKPLGQFISSGVNVGAFGWIPLTDPGGVAPITVNISGAVTSFQVETPTGDCYPNYFMLVPASGIHVLGTLSGNNISISFPTQKGGDYRIFYRNNLIGGNWTLLKTVLGNGSVESVTDSFLGRLPRYYKVTSP